jgi:predicted pyridoxine 5'-phosphate oxidase superfamily flavin-nucleotide-binding protein
MLTADMRAVIEAAHLCFAATVCADGSPNLSPKGTIRVWDETRLFFLDIDSPQTATNLHRDPRIVVNVVEQLSRRGYRFWGRGTLHRGDLVWSQATGRVFEEEGARYTVQHAVLITVERAEPLVSPGYANVADERDMRAAWKVRRAALDAAFDAYLASASHPEQ